MYFYKWMQQFAAENSPRGELARRMASSDRCAKHSRACTASHLRFLVDTKAGPEMLEAFEEAFGEYQLDCYEEETATVARAV